MKSLSGITLIEMRLASPPPLQMRVRPGATTATVSYYWTVTGKVAPVTPAAAAAKEAAVTAAAVDGPAAATAKYKGQLPVNYTVSYQRLGPGPMYLMTGTVQILNPSEYMYTLEYVEVTASSEGSGAGSTAQTKAVCPKAAGGVITVPNSKPGQLPAQLVCNYTVAVRSAAPRMVAAVARLTNLQQVAAPPVPVEVDDVSVPKAPAAASAMPGACAYLSDTPLVGGGSG